MVKVRGGETCPFPFVQSRIYNINTLQELQASNQFNTKAATCQALLFSRHEIKLLTQPANYAILSLREKGRTMTYKTSEFIWAGKEQTLEIELEVTWHAAEPDVGIMGDYIDDYAIVAVNGKTQHIAWVDRILASHEKAIIEAIYDNN